MIFDPISDMLTRIRNASKVKKLEVILPFSKIKMRIADILVREGYLNGAEKFGDKLPNLKLHLKYDDHLPVINELRRVSKPGRRVYLGKDALRKIPAHSGLKIVSTSSGLMTNVEAKANKLGGEIICEVN